MRVFLQHDPEEWAAGGEDQLVGTNYVSITDLQQLVQPFNVRVLFDLEDNSKFRFPDGSPNVVFVWLSFTNIEY